MDLDDMFDDMISRKGVNHFYFYHIAPKNIEAYRGILTMQYMYNRGENEMLRIYGNKYRYKLQQLYYPDRDPKSLNSMEILESIRKYRGDKSACNRVYFYKFPPHPDYMNEIDYNRLTNKKAIFRIDLTGNTITKYIRDIDWGCYNGEPLDRSYYEKVTPEEYWKDYGLKCTGDHPANSPIRCFSIGIGRGQIPKELITKIKKLSKE